METRAKAFGETMIKRFRNPEEANRWMGKNPEWRALICGTGLRDEFLVAFVKVDNMTDYLSLIVGAHGNQLRLIKTRAKGND